jgi:hypothetical protein
VLLPGYQFYNRADHGILIRTFYLLLTASNISLDLFKNWCLILFFWGLKLNASAIIVIVICKLKRGGGKKQK